MGGFGSGGIGHNCKSTTDRSHGLSIHDLHTKRSWQAGRIGTWHWFIGEAKVAGITVIGHGDSVTLSYSVQIGGNWENVSQLIALEWTPCSFGGNRPWFRCPGCGRRVGSLFGTGKLYYCRHCYDLAYESQRESVGDRALRKAQKIRQRLGGSANMLAPFPDKPKRMRWETYDRLRHISRQAELQSWEATAARFKIPSGGITK